MKCCHALMWKIICYTLALCSSKLYAQLPIHETFKNSTAPNWVFGGSPPAYLTAGVIDAEGDGYLRLTNNNHDQTGIAGCVIILPTHKGFVIEFEYNMHDGLRIFDNPAYPTGDGICFALVDSSVNPNNYHAGAFGGSLGYAQKVIRNADNTADSLIPGLSNAYIGIGFDVVGNFSNATEGRIGGTPTQDTSSVTIRGPGEGTVATIGTDYPWIATTQTTTLPGDRFSINDETAGRAADSTVVGWRKVRVEMVPKPDINGQDSAFVIYVYMFTEGSPAVKHLVMDSINYNYKPPGYMKVGFTGGTGSGTNIQEVRYLDVTTYAPLDTPHAAQDSLSACKNNSLVFDPLRNDTSFNGPPPNITGIDFNRATIDLDTLAEGIQRTKAIADTGVFVVNDQGLVTFTPVADFEGDVSLYYTVTDLYGAKSTAAPIKAFIKSSLGDAITILKEEVGACFPDGVNLNTPDVFSTTAPGDVSFYSDALGTQSVADPADITQSGTYYIKLAAAGCEDIKPVIVTISVNTVQPLPVTNYSCDPATLTVAASGAAPGEGYRWFDAATGGNLLKTSTNNLDSTFTSPDVLNTTTDFWVEKYLTDPLGCVSASRTKVTAIINTATLSPDAGPDQSLAEGSTAATLNAVPLTSDEINAGSIAYWSFVSGPSSPVIQNSGSNTTSVTNLSANGDYLFTWTVQQNTCSKTDTVLIRLGSPLPVIYADFSATLQNDVAVLQWTTATEWNNTGFDIERSIDGIRFNRAGFVPAAGNNSTEQTKYRFEDVLNNVQSDKVYYRLKQIDIDGNYAYSKVLVLNRSNSNNLLRLYPNPFTQGSLRISADMLSAGAVTVRITDLAGRTLQQQDLILVKGSNNLSVSAGDQLSNGLYYVEVWKNGKRMLVTKLIKR
jgi:hypothetical protein